jgi:CpcD/allophycocyanin linker domain
LYKFNEELIMLGQSASTLNNPIFVYEVTGLHGNESACQVRNSNTLMNVPLNRMNEAMQQIASSGGKIVSIRPLVGAGAPAAEQSTAKSDN